MSIGLTYWPFFDDRMRVREEFIDHPYAFHVFVYMLGFLMVFRTNFAYGRYWEAMGTMQAMGAKWLDGALMGIIFDAGGNNNAHLLHGMYSDASLEDHAKTAAKGGPVHSVFAADVCHLCSLMHALALAHLRGDSDLDNIGTAKDSAGDKIYMEGSVTEQQKPSRSPKSQVPSIPNFDEKRMKQVFKQQKLRVLGGLGPHERQALEMECNGRPFSGEARVAMVEGWFMRRLLARQKFEQGESAATSPPILSRLYQVISDGGLWFSHASKIAITPFPFPYHNLIAILLWTYTFCVPFLVNGLIMDTGGRGITTFLAVFAYHSLAKVGDNLEDPYSPYDPNELPLPEIQDSVNIRLLMFGVVPEPMQENGERLAPAVTATAETLMPSIVGAPAEKLVQRSEI